MKRVSFPMILAVAAVLFPYAGYTQTNESQPHMRNALEHLRQAEQELQAAERDKGGHRVQALQFVNQAEREIQEGMRYDTQHETQGEEGYRQGPEAVRITSGPVIETLDDHSAVIAWGTNVQGSSRVEYGTDQRNLSQLAEAPWGAGGLTHRVRIDNLRSNTVYFFDIETGQARGTGTEVEGGRLYSFQTLPTGAPPLRNQEPR